MEFVKRFRDFIDSYFKSTFGFDWISYEEFWRGVLKDKELFHPKDRVRIQKTSTMGYLPMFTRWCIFRYIEDNPYQSAAYLMGKKE